MSKTVLITGSSTGIGNAAASLFHDKGWNVAATMRNPDAVRNLQSLNNVACLHLDVTDSVSVRQAVADTISRFGSIDVVVNNAAYTLTGPFEGATAEQIQSLYDVDVFGVMNVTREVLPHFRSQGRGMLINVTSLGGLIGLPHTSFYASAKWAVEGFSESLRFELGELGIGLKIVEPGGVRTSFADNAIIVRKPDVPSYEAALQRRLAAYERRRSRLSDPTIIYRAATDGSDRLRYVAGNDARVFWTLRQLLPFRLFSALLRRMSR